MKGQRARTSRAFQPSEIRHHQPPASAFSIPHLPFSILAFALAALGTLSSLLGTTTFAQSTPGQTPAVGGRQAKQVTQSGQNPQIIAPSSAFGPGSSTQDVLAGLKSKDSSTRIDAIRSLWRDDRPAPQVILPPLIECLSTNVGSGAFTKIQRSRVHAEAAVALGLIGPPARSAIPALISTLDDPDEWARADAAEAIGQIAPAQAQALPALIKAIRDPSVRVQSAANRALLTPGPVNLQVIRAFIRAMHDHAEVFNENRPQSGPEGNIGDTSQEFFGMFGPEQRYALDDLVAMAKDSHPGIQRIGFIGLNGIGEIPEEFVPVLVDALPDDVAAVSLRILGPKAKEAVPRFTAAMEEERDRFLAAELLVAVGPPAAKSAIPVFVRFINQAQYPELYLCEDLLKIDPGSSIALNGFEKLTALPPKTLPDLLNVLVAHARLIQANRDPQTHTGFLAGKVRDPQESVGVCASRLLLDCQAQNPTRTNALNRIFQVLDTGTNDWTVGVAEQALEHLGPADKAYVPKLVSLLSRYPSPAVIAALGQVGPEARDAIPRLKPLLQYNSEAGEPFRALHDALDFESVTVRKAAAEAIRRIEPPPGDKPPAR